MLSCHVCGRREYVRISLTAWVACRRNVNGVLDVILLPGWGAPTRTMSDLARALESSGMNTRALTYPWWDPRHDLESLGHHVAGQLTSNALVVGHSLGGVVARLAARDATVGAVVTIATPLHGVDPLAAIAFGPARQLRRDDPQLALAREDLEVPALSVVSTGDRIVGTGSSLPVPAGADALVGNFGSHLGILAHPQVHAAVCQTLLRVRGRHFPT